VKGCFFHASIPSPSCVQCVTLTETEASKSPDPEPTTPHYWFAQADAEEHFDIGTGNDVLFTTKATGDVAREQARDLVAKLQPKCDDCQKDAGIVVCTGCWEKHRGDKR
jgi:hypothetical protein